MLSFRALSEKKTKIKINPKQTEITEMEKNHGEDCDCMKCERKRRQGEKEPEVATESAVPGKPAERLVTDRNMFSIDKDERAAAAERLKAKAAAKRKAKGMKEGYYDPMEDPDFDHDEAERTRGQSGKPAKKKTKKSTKKEEVAYVSQEEVSEESNQEIAETETFLTFGEFQEARNAYAVGMARAQELTGDTPPLKKSTITKAHEIAKAIKKEEVNLQERGDFWHPDPDEDRKLGGPGANQRAREDRAAASKPKPKSNSLRPGESYMDYAKRQRGYTPPKKKEGILSRVARKVGLKNSYEPEGNLVDEATRAAKEGKKDDHRVGVEIRAKQAATSLAAKKARQKVLDAHEKKTGTKLDISKSPEGKTHAKHFGGSRQTKKVKGEKETDLETHNRRVGRDTLRKLKHGKTAKERRDDAAMAKHTSRFD